jgi:hypothetical protein
VDTLEANASKSLLEDDALIRIGIDIGLRIQEFDNVDSSATSRRDVGNKRENVSSLDGTEDGALVTSDSMKN